ncbi:hypothetical protein SPHINGOR109_50615 [Sphingorhabdus sp. 109]|jgi:hypothetical protein|nr:hypothetical protein SPHINGOR109_50615 [Sphingorhabdus sp. 109]
MVPVARALDLFKSRIDKTMMEIAEFCDKEIDQPSDDE